MSENKCVHVGRSQTEERIEGGGWMDAESDTLKIWSSDSWSDTICSVEQLIREMSSVMCVSFLSL